MRCTPHRSGVSTALCRSGIRRRRSRLLACGRVVAAGLALVLYRPSGADALGPPHVDVGIAAGSAMADASLEDYGWLRDPRTVWGVEATAGWSRFDVGLRAETAGERSHLPDGTGGDLPGLRIAGVTAIGRVVGFRVRGAELFALGSLGRAHLAFQPEQASARPPGLPEALDVGFPSEWMWTTGVGAGVRRELGRGPVVAIEGERNWLALETAHRRGDAIVEERERFGTWNLRVRLSWRLRSP